MATIANTEVRTIGIETMNQVLKYAPIDGFKLSDDKLNKEYTVIDVNEFETGTTKSFTVTLEDKSGNIITLSAGNLKRARLLTTNDVTGAKPMIGTENIFKRSDADSIWNGSVYFHKGIGMKKDEEFVLPGKITLRYAILSEDLETGEPLLNPFLYKGYRKVVKEYIKADDFPSMDDFRSELKKTEADGRFKFLPKEMLEPTPFAWVNRDVSDYKHTLVLQVNS